MYANTNAVSTSEAQSEDGSGVEATGMTLDGFIKQHTSEDNEHFKEQQAVSLAAHKKKYWWVYDDDPNHHLRLLSDGQRMSVRKHRDVFWEHCHNSIERSRMAFVPEHVQYPLV